MKYVNGDVYEGNWDDDKKEVGLNIYHNGIGYRYQKTLHGQRTFLK